MSRVTSPLERATTPTALTRVAQFDYWHVVDRETGAEVAVTVDRSVPDVGLLPLRVVGYVVVLDGQTLAAGPDRVPAWARKDARSALVWGRSVARAARRRRAYADRVLGSVGDRRSPGARP